MFRLEHSHSIVIALSLALTAVVEAALVTPTTAAERSNSASNVAFPSHEWLDQYNPEVQLLVQQQQQPRTALVIGNADYGPDDRLAGPDDDARAMYEKLRDLGFDVPPPLINANKQQIDTAVRDFVSRMTPNGVNVFYYSGHGVQIDGRNYLLPIGLNESSSEVDIQYNAILLDYVVSQMYSIAHDFNFLIIDACRNNPFINRWGRPKGPGNQGLASTRPPRGTMIAYATQENEIAIDSAGSENSPFTASLLKYLSVPDLNIFELLTNVATEVAEQTNNDQIPAWEGNPRRIIPLNPTAVAASPSPPPVPQPIDSTPSSSNPAQDDENIHNIQEQVSTQRVQFPDGQTGTLLANSIGPGQVRRYLVNAQQGQIITAKLAQADGPVVFDVSFPGGEPIDEAEGVLYWNTYLPLGGDYAIDVRAGTPLRRPIEFTLDVELVGLGNAQDGN